MKFYLRDGIVRSFPGVITQGNCVIGAERRFSKVTLGGSITLELRVKNIKLKLTECCKHIFRMRPQT